MHAGHVVQMRPYLVHLRDVQAFERFVELLVRFRAFLNPTFEHAHSLQTNSRPPLASVVETWRSSGRYHTGIRVWRAREDCTNATTLRVWTSAHGQPTPRRESGECRRSRSPPRP